MAATIVDATRFKTLLVTSKCTIQDFVSRNKLDFKPGKGFLQITKPETIQVYKEIVARRKSDGSFVMGAALRTILGISSTGSEKFKLDNDKLTDFDIFIQSTSYNRVLIAGTEFLYEADDSSPGMTMSDIIAARKKAETEKLPSAAVQRPTLSKAATVRTVDPPGGPGSPIEIVFCFDTTGSMGGCILEVRKYVQDVIQRLLTDIPTIRICAFAHGDYIDRHKYVTTYLDFTRDKQALCEWVESVETTYGGDWEECYELALHEVRTKLSWTGGTQRALVMIGDAIPHEPHQSEAKLDWEVELDALVNDLGVRIYAVQCGTNLLAKEFWSALGERSGGKHLYLDDFGKVIDLILAICYREQGMEQLQAYEAEVRAREKKEGKADMNEALKNLFKTLKSPDKVPSIRRGDSVAGMAHALLAPAAASPPAAGPSVAAAAVSPAEKKTTKKRKVPPAVGASGSPVKRGRPASASKARKPATAKATKAGPAKKAAKPVGRKPKAAAVAKKTPAARKTLTKKDTAKKPRGRPKKVAEKAAKRPRGRPKSTDVAKKEKSTRGRPKVKKDVKKTKARSVSRKPAAQKGRPKKVGVKRKLSASPSRKPAKKARASSVKGRKVTAVVKKRTATPVKKQGRKPVQKKRGRPPGKKTEVKGVVKARRGRPPAKKTGVKTVKKGKPKANAKGRTAKNPAAKKPAKKAAAGKSPTKKTTKKNSAKKAGKAIGSKKKVVGSKAAAPHKEGKTTQGVKKAVKKTKTPVKKVTKKPKVASPAKRGRPSTKGKKTVVVKRNTSTVKPKAKAIKTSKDKVVAKKPLAKKTAKPITKTKATPKKALNKKTPTGQGKPRGRPKLKKD